MSFNKQQVQSAISTALGADRLTSCEPKILFINAKEKEVSGELNFFGNAMAISAGIVDEGKSISSIKVSSKSGAPSNISIRQLEDFLSANKGLANDHKLTDFFPDNFPITSGIVLKEIELGLDNSDRSGYILKSLSIKFGTPSSWSIIDIGRIELEEVNVLLSNEDISQGIETTTLSIEGLISIERTTLDLTVGNLTLGDPQQVLQNLQFQSLLKNVEIPVGRLMHKILPRVANDMWELLTPSALKNIKIDEFFLSYSPGKQLFNIYLITNLGSFEIVLKPIGENGTSNQKNVLIAISPPPNNDGTFFSDIGRKGSSPGPLAKLDTLDLSDSGMVFSSYEDSYSTSLPALQAHTLDKKEGSALEVKEGIQFFSKIKFRDNVPATSNPNDGKDEQIISGLIHNGNSKVQPSLNLGGFIAKDLTSYELEVGVDFGSKGVNLIPKSEVLKLREIQLALILELVPGYAGFRLGGVMDAKIQQDLLRFDADMEFGVLPAFQTFVMKGAFEMESLNPSNTAVTQIWEDAFGIPGFGLSNIGSSIGIGVNVSSGIPAPALIDFGFKANVQLGTVEGQEVTGITDLKFDIKKPTQSKIDLTLKDTTLVDIVEAFDSKKSFNLKGPVREMMNIGFETLDAVIDPKNSTFSFKSDLKLRILEVKDAEVSLSPNGIHIGGKVSPLVIKFPGTELELFALRGKNSGQATVDLNLDSSKPTEAKFLVDGELVLFGGAAAKADTTIEITPRHVKIDTEVNLLGGSMAASVALQGEAITPKGAGMYAQVEVKNNVLGNIKEALREEMNNAYSRDRDAINAAQKELEELRKHASFLAPLLEAGKGALEGIKGLQDAGRIVGAMLLNEMDKVFNIDHIRFEGNLDALGSMKGKSGSSEILAEVQLTIARRVINEKIKIDFSKGISSIVSAIKKFLLDAFNFLKGVFNSLKKGLSDLFALFEKGAKALVDFAKNTIEKVSEFFKDVLDEIKRAFEQVGEAFDNLFNGARFPLALNGNTVAYGPGYRHYAIRVKKIKCIKENLKAKIYGVIAMDPENTMRLGSTNNNGNLIAFSARRGGAGHDPKTFIPSKGPLKLLTGEERYLNDTKHFYVQENRSQRIVFICSLRQRGGLAYSEGNRPVRIDLKPMKWSTTKDVALTRSITLKSDDKKDRYQIQITFEVILKQKVGDFELKEAIRSKTKYLDLFDRGADPATNGLMTEALSRDVVDAPTKETFQIPGTIVKVDSPIEAIKNLLKRGVKPNSEDVTAAIKLNNPEALTIFLKNGAKPVKEHLVMALTMSDTSIDIIKSLLLFKVVPDNKSLKLAFQKGGSDFAKAILKYNVQVDTEDLLSAIKLGNLALLKLVLKNGNSTKLLNSDVYKAATLQAISSSNKNLLKELLKKQIKDQTVYQTSLIEVCDKLNSSLLNEFLKAGARIESSMIIDTFISALKKSGITNQIKKMLIPLLEHGGDPSRALKKAIEVDPTFAMSKWISLIQACLDKGANPDQAIVYAINNKSIKLLSEILKKGAFSTGKANFALRLIVEKSIVNPSKDQATTKSLAKIALEAKADPNEKILISALANMPRYTGKRISCLVALGEAKQYDILEELLNKRKLPNRLPVNAKALILLAINNSDLRLVKSLVAANVSLEDDSTYLIKAAQKNDGKAVLLKLLDHGALPSTEALEITIKNQDFVSAKRIIAAGSKGTPQMLNVAMVAQQLDLLTQLRTVTQPNNNNFQIAANLNRSDYFAILVGSDGRLSTVKPLETSILLKNTEILQLGLNAGYPSKGAIATEALLFSISMNWKEGINICLEYEAETNPAIKYAVINEDASLLNSIVNEHGGSPDFALELSIQRSKETFAKNALELGANPDFQIANVAQANNDSLVRLLVKFGANPDLAMMSVIGHKNVSLTKYLLEQGADASRAWYLEEALEVRELKIVNLLLKNGADPRGMLEIPIRNEDGAIIRTLVRNGADPTEGLKIYLEIRQDDGTDELLKGFIKLKANLDVHLGIPARRRHASMVELMVERGANPSEGMVGAVHGGDIEIFKYLISKGASLDDPAIMDSAINNARVRMVSLLVGYEVDLNTIRSGGNTYLMLIAAQVGKHTIMRTLLKGGADPNIKNDLLDTALHIAAAQGKGNLKSIELLVNNGARLNLKNANGHRALFVAKGKTVVDYLRSKGAKGRVPKENLLED